MGAWGVAIPAALWALDKVFGGGISGGSAISEATNKMGGSIDKATQTIKDATDKAMAFNAPYMNPEVFKRLSDLVTSGAFQKPFAKSFQPLQWNTPNMSINPAMGNFSMIPFQGGPPPTFTPQGLPVGMAQLVQRPSPIPTAPPQLPPMITPAEAAKKANEAELLKGRPPMPQMGRSWGAMGAPAISSFNPQTGQGSPLQDMGVKPIDPRFPDPMAMLQMRLLQPWRFGGSGPLEGGLPRGGVG